MLMGSAAAHVYTSGLPFLARPLHSPQLACCTGCHTKAYACLLHGPSHSSDQRGVSLPGGAGGGLLRGRGLGDAAAPVLAMLLAGMDTRGGGAADCLLQHIELLCWQPVTYRITGSLYALL